MICGSRAFRSFVPKGVDRIELGGFHRGPYAEENADGH